MPELTNVLLLAGEALIYFVALGALLRARKRIGLGAFFCALGVMHFLETYLAGLLYVPLPDSLVKMIEKTWTDDVKADGKPVWP